LQYGSGPKKSISWRKDKNIKPEDGGSKEKMKVVNSGCYGQHGLRAKSQLRMSYDRKTHFYDHKFVMICHITNTAANVAAKSRPWPIIVSISTPLGFPCPSFTTGPDRHLLKF
jgi:hypothetical protein